MHVRESQRDLEPAFSFNGEVPVCLEGCTIEICQQRYNQVENGDHDDRCPYNDGVYGGEFQTQQVGADGVLQNSHCDQVDDLIKVQEIAVLGDIARKYNAGVLEVSPQSVLHNLEAEDGGHDIQDLQQILA